MKSPPRAPAATWSPPRASPPSSSMPNWRSCARAPTAWPPCWPRRCRGCPIPAAPSPNTAGACAGRSMLVMVDGVPLNTNRDSSRSVANIDPALIERIEVIRGNGAIYSSGAAGGIISITTRPAGGENRAETRLSATSPLTRLGSDGLGGQFQQYFAGSLGRSTIRSTSAPRHVGASYDAHGDRIARRQQPGRPVRLERLQHRRQARPAHRREPARAARSQPLTPAQDADYATGPRVAEAAAGARSRPARSKARGWTEGRAASATPWRTQPRVREPRHPRQPALRAALLPRLFTRFLRSTPAPSPPAAAVSAESCRTAKCLAAA